MYQFRRLLEGHISQKQRINDYAEMLGVSRITLNKAVKKQFNVTATELLKKRLLVEIKSDPVAFSYAKVQDTAQLLNKQ